MLGALAPAPKGTLYCPKCDRKDFAGNKSYLLIDHLEAVHGLTRPEAIARVNEIEAEPELLRRAPPAVKALPKKRARRRSGTMGHEIQAILAKTKLGRPRREVDTKEVKRLRGEGKSWNQVAKALGVHRNTLGRYMYVAKPFGKIQKRTKAIEAAPRKPVGEQNGLVAAIIAKKKEIARLLDELDEIRAALGDSPDTR